MLAADSKVVSAPTADSSNTEPAGSWKQIIDPVEPFLEAVARRLAGQVEAFDPAMTGYADYALNGQGKHLRPALVALCGSALGGTGDDHVMVAVIIETVHLATLVHDDVMDEAEIRRGRLTLAANWGNDIAVLFGDCLFAHALKLAASFPTPEICRAVASATQTVCSGEILQTQHRRDLLLTRDQYFKVLEMKTAELFALSCELSACLCGATPERRQSLRQSNTYSTCTAQPYVLLYQCLISAFSALRTSTARSNRFPTSATIAFGAGALSRAMAQGLPTRMSFLT